MAPLDILIIGCSVAGPTLASFLLLQPRPASQKPRITILERSPTLRTAGQNVDVRGAGVSIIRRLGIEAAIRASTTGEDGVQFVDEYDNIWASFAADKSGKWQTPTSDIEIMRGRLAEICYKRSKSISEDVQEEGGAGIEFLFGDYVEQLEQDGAKVHVRFAKSGERRSYDLVVGADGMQSRTRNLVWGFDGEQDRVKRLGMYGGFFSLPRAESDTMWRKWFHTYGRRGIMLRPDKQQGRTTAHLYVINEEDKRLGDLAVRTQDSIDAQKELLAEYFKGAGWECERITKAMKVTDDFYYDMVAQVKMDKWSKGRVVLLGDAGYCASPISGMGTTLAMCGAYNLAGALNRHPEDFTTAFAEYERKLRPTVERAQKLAPGMPYLINPETKWGVYILHLTAFLFAWTRIANLLFMFLGPPAGRAPVEEYGFTTPSEWKE